MKRIGVSLLFGCALVGFAQNPRSAVGQWSLIVLAAIVLPVLWSWLKPPTMRLLHSIDRYLNEMGSGRE